MSEPITTLKEDDIQAIAVMREQANLTPDVKSVQLNLGDFGHVA